LIYKTNFAEVNLVYLLLLICGEASGIFFVLQANFDVVYCDTARVPAIEKASNL
jgi:hypothetical protein